jgi:ubiquinol-cytochrome c reductase iron-sulfur subunit
VCFGLVVFVSFLSLFILFPILYLVFFFFEFLSFSFVVFFFFESNQSIYPSIMAFRQLLTRSATSLRSAARVASSTRVSAVSRTATLSRAYATASSVARTTARSNVTVARQTIPLNTVPVRKLASSSHGEDTQLGSQDTVFDDAQIGGDPDRRTFAYFAIGSARFMYAASVRMIALKLLSQFSATADVLALAKIEVDIGAIPEGKTIRVKWQGKPVFIRHRTDKEIAEMAAVPMSDLPDPETDAVRVQNPKYLVALGICTHLGCVPVSDAGDYGGWFCPCHGSHYDFSARIRKGPAPRNLDVPPYTFVKDTEIVIG